MIARLTGSRSRAKLSVLAAAAMVLLTGCGSLHPGVAVVVGSASISHGEVDDVARALCSANLKGAEAQGQQAPDLASRGARRGALQILLDSKLSQMFGQAKGIEPNEQQVSQALAQNEQGVQMLPAGQREDFRSAIKGYAEGQLILIQAGRASLREQGQTKITNDQAVAEGHRLRAQYVKTVDVEIDPRYGSFKKDTLVPGGTALSVAQSKDALIGEKSDTNADFVSSLPASQKCT